MRCWEIGTEAENRLTNHFQRRSRMPPSNPSKRPRQARRAERKLSTTVPPRPRTHAFTGCLTCRERHVKCDLGQPACQNCTRLKVPCEGYARKYSWMSPKGPGQRRRLSDPDSVEEAEESQSSRRVLFSGKLQTFTTKDKD